ncbi:uncharacterized protein At1g15400-like [Phragmites australis]|uniref:uncharacterized protein At1g15400-like n=1 Tax=Phragmites australis TaxID=29695 RepID=UPI002D77B015|nr:uncharacterized protein At1g15400-like [Phragmites australis]
MAGLQRSVQTFRRSGSSGLIWDELFLTEGGGAVGPRPELRNSRSVGSIGALRRRGRDEGGGIEDKKRKLALVKQKQKGHQKQEEKAFRTRDVAPAVDPPSPRVSGCCPPCTIF